MIKNLQKLQKRSVVLELSDMDCDEILRICGAHGITLSELLENYIHDLIGGSRSNGSDERAFAEQYFSRCLFTVVSEETMLKFLLEVYGPGIAADFLDIYDSIEDAKKDLEAYEKDPQKFDEEEIQYTKEDLENWQEEYNSFISAYKEIFHLDFNDEKEIPIMRKWCEEREALLYNIVEDKTESEERDEYTTNN